jgi:hypothetical protein
MKVMLALSLALNTTWPLIPQSHLIFPILSPTKTIEQKENPKRFYWELTPEEIEELKQIIEEEKEEESIQEEVDNSTENIGVEVFSTGTSSYHIDWNGSRLSPSIGVNQGPSGVEKYYNLDMSGCVAIMRNMGYDEINYPYWIREDGCKCLGPYIMVAAGFDVRPRGTLVETSLGTGIVVDTGGFAYEDPYMIDICVNW